MQNFQINYGICGGYNVHHSEVIEADNEEEATQIAYECAAQLFESYNVFGRQYPNYDYDSMDEETYESDYLEEMERWIDYSAEPV